MKNLNELSALVGSAYNSLKESIGVKFPASLGNWFDTIIKGQPAIEDIGKSREEAATGTVDDFVGNSQVFTQELTAVDQDEQFHLTRIHDGLVSGYALVAKGAYEKGVEDTLAAVAEQEGITDDQLQTLRTVILAKK